MYHLRHIFALILLVVLYPENGLGFSLSVDSGILTAVQVASAVVSYVGCIAYWDRPQGLIKVDPPSVLKVDKSQVEGAGLGLFVAKDLPKGTILGNYPGVVLPIQNANKKVQDFPKMGMYSWRFQDSQFIIDPTDSRGELQPLCRGGNPGTPASQFICENLLPLGVPTDLCRINEPPKNMDVNVIREENTKARTVTFILERDVSAGDELFMDYGVGYDRSAYSGSKKQQPEPQQEE